MSVGEIIKGAIGSASDAVAPYKFWIKLGGLAIVFLFGCYVTSLYYKNEMNDEIQKRKDAEIALTKAAAHTNTVYIEGKTKVVTKYVYRDKIVNHYITTATEVLPKGFVEYYNAAVENRDLLTMTDAQAAEKSDKTMMDLARVSNYNLTTCNKYRLQILGLQDVLRAVEKASK